MFSLFQLVVLNVIKQAGAME